jgi:hypothetical protein
MRRIFVLLSCAVATLAIAVAPAQAASQNAAVMAAVDQFIDGFNRGDVKAEIAACAPQSSIIDDFPPHEWQGQNACGNWAAAYDAMAKSEGITNAGVTMNRPWQVSVTNDRAYVVVPVAFSYTKRGKRIVEGGAVFTVALQRLAAGWRITGWAWASR